MRKDQLHSTGTKARVGRTRQTYAGLERQLKACRREVARVRARLVELMKQQTATSEILRIISDSPIQSVLDAVAEHAARLCDSNNAEIFHLETNLLRLVASYGEIPVAIYAREGIPANRDSVTGRAACDRRTVHVHNLAIEDSEYPLGSSNAKREGHRTTLATPLLREGTPIGVILIRRWEVRPFSDNQIALLEIFAAHAVIAIENVRLFEAEKQRALALAQANRDLAQREAKIRRLVDANIIGIFIWNFDGRILEANDAFLHIVGYDHEDLSAGRIQWTDLTPPEWRDRDTQLIQEHRATGILQPFEKEYFRKDGSRVPVLIGVATFEDSGDQGVAFVLDLTERKRAEEALRESERKLRQFIESVPAHFWSASPDGKATHVNQRLLDYFGIRLEDQKASGLEDQRPSDWKAVLHPDDVAETERALNHAFQTGEFFQRVHRLRRRDGEYRWHRVRAEPLRDHEGHIIQWYGFSIDIDEAKKAEEQLRRSEANLAEAQKLSRTGSWALSPSTTKIFYWSEECYRIWGFDPAQGVPNRETVWRRIHPDDQKRVVEEAEHALREKRDYSSEFRIVLPDGTVKHLETISHHLFSADGDLVQIVGTNVDVTERKRTEEALRRDEAWLAQAQRLSHTGTWVMNGTTRRFLYWSDESYRIWGFDPMQGLPSREDMWGRIHPDDRERIWGEVQEALREETDFFAEFRILLPDGTVKYLEANTHHEFSPHGALLEVVCTNVDVTERKRAQDEREKLRQLESDLAHMNRLSVMGELAASLAHEIAQPIATARNNARAAMNFLARSPSEPGEVRESLACVVDDADRAAEILDRIRDQIKKTPPRKERVDLNKAITDVIALAQSAIIKNGVSVQTDLIEGLPHIQADRVQLQQVILNLILNAVEAMSSVEKRVRRLSISTEQHQSGGVLVSVRDSGPGIDSEHLDRIFDAFYTTKSSGVGMGLSICRSIIKAHGGHLWAEANAPRGSAFQFTLPNAVPPATSNASCGP
jgi:PAS domain S-box-containing protein